MDFINLLISEKKYILYNVDENKRPKVGTKEKGWSKITYEDSLTFHNKDSLQWAIRTGIQPNGPGAPHRVKSSSCSLAGSKRPLFRSNTSVDRTGCGKMGLVEFPVKDSMFNSYRTSRT